MNKYVGVLLLIIFVSVIFAHSSYSGYTLLSRTTGCSCHGSANSSITATLSGPDALKPGATGVYQLTITGGSGSQVCADIAASSGSLSPNGTALKTSGSELITNGTKTYSNGSYTYTFNYTAPATEGTQTLYGLGMSSKSSGWNFTPNKSITISSTATGIEEDLNSIPTELTLSQNYPNPFNPTTEIAFELPNSGFVNGEVLDITGAVVDNLINTNMNAGIHTIRWNANNRASGIYFFRLSSGNSIKTIKMILSK